MVAISVKAILRGPHGVLFLRNPREELELPGGRPDEGENLEGALRREVLEECRIVIRTAEYLESASFEVLPNRRVLVAIFDCGFTDESPIVSEEHLGFEWVDPAKERPAEMPQFYWSAMRRSVNASTCFGVARSNNGGAFESIPYPLDTGTRDWDRLEITFRIYNASSEEFLRPLLPREGDFLDVGCGHGQMTRWMAKAAPGASILGVDSSRQQIEVARSEARRERLSNMAFAVSDIFDMDSAGLPHRMFDVIYCRFVLLHIKDRMLALRRLLDHLGPKGILVIEEPSLASLYSVPPVKAFSEANVLIHRFGLLNGIDYDCIEEIWSCVQHLGVRVVAAKFSQPTVWVPEVKRIVGLSFRQFQDRLISSGLITPSDAERISHALDHEFLDPRVISTGLRTLQLAIRRADDERG